MYNHFIHNYQKEKCKIKLGLLTIKKFLIVNFSKINDYKHTTQPFYGCVEFVRENPGEPVPEETFTHYSHRCHQSSLSAFSI